MSDKKNDTTGKSNQGTLEKNNQSKSNQPQKEASVHKSLVLARDTPEVWTPKEPPVQSPSVKKVSVDKPGDLDDFDDLDSSDFSFVSKKEAIKRRGEKLEPKSLAPVPTKTPAAIPVGATAVKDIPVNKPKKTDPPAKVQPVVPKVSPARLDPSKVYSAATSSKNGSSAEPLGSKAPEKPKTSKAPSAVVSGVPKVKPPQLAPGKVPPKQSTPKSAESSKKSSASGPSDPASFAKPPESKAPESKAPESKAPESKAPESKAPEKPKTSKAPSAVVPGVPKVKPPQLAPGKVPPKQSTPKSAESSKKSPASGPSDPASFAKPPESKAPDKPKTSKAPSAVVPRVPKVKAIQLDPGKVYPKKSTPKSEEPSKESPLLQTLNDPKPEVKKKEKSEPTPVSESVQVKAKAKAEKMEVMPSDKEKSSSLSQSTPSTKAVSKWAFWKRPSRRDEQLTRISDGYVEMVDLVRAIRGQLESQNENNVILRDSLSHLPEAMKGLDSFSKSQHTVGEALQEIHGQMQRYSSKDEKLADSMEGFNSTLKGMDNTSKASIQTFDRVQERMRDSDIRMENLFRSVQEAEGKVSDTMVRLQRNMAIMQGIFLFCLIIVIGVLVMTVMSKDDDPKAPTEESAVRAGEPAGQPAGVMPREPREVVVPPTTEGGR